MWVQAFREGCGGHVRARARLLLLMLPLGVASGCVVGQSLPVAYTPSATDAPSTAPSAQRAVVSVSVTDDRPFVKSGKEPPYYLGKYRAAIGTPWDVTTENKEPLASLIERDLKADIAALGHLVTESAPADRSVVVSIHDWNFTGYQNGRLWYEILVSVLGPTGSPIALSTIQDEEVIKGTLLMGARGGFERDMPDLYQRIIRKLVRENEVVSSALAESAR